MATVPVNRLTASFLPPITLDARSKTPLYRQIAVWFQRAIVDGQLRPGQRAPSRRALADELKISRIPVLGAYELLIAEGYLRPFVGAGTCVSESIPDGVFGSRHGSAGAAEERFEPSDKRRTSQRAGGMLGLRRSGWSGRAAVSI
jgi:GntR family transcriptional regulator/MocR family aminotransferase